MAVSKKSKGSINTKKLMHRIKKSNVIFDNDDHHDSHEFLSWLLNEIHESLIADAKEIPNSMLNNRPVTDTKSSFITELFEGKLESKTTCLWCENGGRREETFMALSVDIERNTSLSHCIRLFSRKELMAKRDKFYCDNCNTKQVAARQMMIKKKPKVLIIHLKRFKIDPQTYRYQKLSYRVPFPSELKIETCLEDLEDENGGSLYHLRGVVIHIG